MNPDAPIRSRNSCVGFTLTEIMFALGITCMVIAGFCAVFITQMTQYRKLRDATEMQQNGQAAMMLLQRDVRQAGYGLPVASSQLSQWVTWVANITNPVSIVQGAGGAPDRLFLTGGFGTPLGTLQSAAARGATTLQLGAGQGANFNTSNRKLIFIGKEELARITAINVGANQLTISTHLTLAGRGVRSPYPAGTSVELIQVLEYGCDNSFTNTLRRPFMYRNDHRGSTSNRVQQMTTIGLDDFQVTQTNNTVSITLSGVAAHKERGYTHPTRGDGYRRTIIPGKAISRNRRN